MLVDGLLLAGEHEWLFGAFDENINLKMEYLKWLIAHRANRESNFSLLPRSTHVCFKPIVYVCGSVDESAFSQGLQMNRLPEKHNRNAQQIKE